MAARKAGPSVANLADGSFVVTWATGGPNPPHIESGIYGQIYGPDVNTVGAEFKINSSGATGDSETLVTSFKSGGFIVT